MDKLHFLDAMLVSISNVFIFLFLDHYLGKYLTNNLLAGIFFGAGLLLFFFHRKIPELIFKKSIRIAEDFFAAISYVLLFIGLKVYLSVLVENYIIIVGVMGLVLFMFHDRLVGLVAQYSNRG